MTVVAEKKRTEAELRELALAGAVELNSLREANPDSPEATAQAVIEWVSKNFAVDAAAVACSMADAVLPAIVADQLPGVEVLFLDTGYHFVETHATRNEVAERMKVRVLDVTPKQTVAEQDAEYGAKLYERDPNLCCALRKVQPLTDQLQSFEVWFTGVRRDEAETRANTPLVGWDEKNGLVKVNPLAAWTFDELIDYATEHSVPTNLLLQHGYPSIGCEPCTKPVAPGEDPRSGRWAGTGKVECGLHL
ncbi:MAG: phosphoadenylyl-sulfate reductase [Micrococcales bacterium]